MAVDYDGFAYVEELLAEIGSHRESIHAWREWAEGYVERRDVDDPRLRDRLTAFISNHAQARDAALETLYHVTRAANEEVRPPKDADPIAHRVFEMAQAEPPDGCTVVNREEWRRLGVQHRQMREALEALCGFGGERAPLHWEQARRVLKQVKGKSTPPQRVR